MPTTPGTDGGSLSALPGSVSGGSVPTAPGSSPAVTLPSTPGSVAGSALSPLPALFATYGGGTGSVADFASAFCNMYSSLISYIGRCTDADDSVVENLESQFGSDVCQAAIAPELERDLGASVPQGVTNVMSCLAGGFERASCSNPEASLASELESCGLALPATL